MKAYPYPIQQPVNAPQPKLPPPKYDQWGKINPDLLAQIYVVDKNGNSKKGGYRVVCAITEGTFEVGSEYSSPFDANPDQRLPTLMGMIQSGEGVTALGNIMANIGATETGTQIGGVVAGVGAALNVATGGLSGSFFGGVVSKAVNLKNEIQSLEGKTNLTKINSTQIFVNTKPIEISVTLYFRAWRDAKKEVEEPVSYLERWALPRSLWDRSIVESVTGRIAKGESGLSGLFPSEAPPFVALQYAKKTFLPFTLRNVSKPLVVERDSQMNALAYVVNAQLSSRTAWDASDIRKLYGG